jgi:hypothetical protein
LESAFHQWSAAAKASPQDPLGAVIAFYLSMAHRAERMDGCPVVALGSDAARQGADVKASFEAGIREYLETLGSWVGEEGGEEPGGKAMAILSTMVGAVLLARAVNDERLSKRFLQAAAESVRRVVRGDAVEPTNELFRRGAEMQTVTGAEPCTGKAMQSGFLRPRVKGFDFCWPTGQRLARLTQFVSACGLARSVPNYARLAAVSASC